MLADPVPRGLQAAIDRSAGLEIGTYIIVYSFIGMMVAAAILAFIYYPSVIHNDFSNLGTSFTSIFINLFKGIATLIQQAVTGLVNAIINAVKNGVVSPITSFFGGVEHFFTHL